MTGTIYLCDSYGSKLIMKKYRNKKYRQEILNKWFKKYGCRNLLVIIEPRTSKSLEK